MQVKTITGQMQELDVQFPFFTIEQTMSCTIHNFYASETEKTEVRLYKNEQPSLFTYTCQEGVQGPLYFFEFSTYEKFKQAVYEASRRTLQHVQLKMAEAAMNLIPDEQFIDVAPEQVYSDEFPQISRTYIPFEEHSREDNLHVAIYNHVRREVKEEAGL